MEQGEKRLSKKGKKKLLKTFGISAGITLAVSLVIIVGVLITYKNTIGNNSRTQFTETPLSEEELAKKNEKDKHGEINTTIAVFGVDKDEVRTDVIFVVNFNSVTQKVKVINVPRDTKVEWTDIQRSKYNQLTGYDITISKLNEMSAYGQIYENPGNIRDFTVDQLENILNITIDNYVIINIEAFNEIVDAIGGVEVDVPERMYYNDNSQDLHIDLSPGFQTLNGKQAEGLVRYRSYLRGDEDRIVVQQAFLKAFAQKVLSPAVFNNMPRIVTSMFSYVKTDVQLNQVLEYLDLFNEFDLSNLEFHTLPGEGSMREGPSYFYIDEAALGDLIIDVFYDTTVAGEEEEELGQNSSPGPEQVIIDTDVSIEILNGTDMKGLAGNLKDVLSKKGYNITRIDNNKEGTIEKSVIYAKDKTKANQFLEYIGDADIVEDTTIKSDVVIVIGNQSADKFK